MKRVCTYHFVCLFLLVITSSALAEQIRKWRSQSGSEIEAKVIDYTPYQSVVLETTDGNRVKIAPSSLSKPDQEYLKAYGLKEEISQSDPEAVSTVLTYKRQQLDIYKRMNELQSQSPSIFYDVFVKDQWYVETSLFQHPAKFDEFQKTFTIIQVVDDNTLLSSWKDQTIAIRRPTNGLYEGQKIRMDAEPIGVYKYTTVLGAPSTIQLYGRPNTLTYEQFEEWNRNDFPFYPDFITIQHWRQIKMQDELQAVHKRKIASRKRE